MEKYAISVKNGMKRNIFIWIAIGAVLAASLSGWKLFNVVGNMEASAKSVADISLETSLSEAVSRINRLERNAASVQRALFFAAPVRLIPAWGRRVSDAYISVSVLKRVSRAGESCAEALRDMHPELDSNASVAEFISLSEARLPTPDTLGGCIERMNAVLEDRDDMTESAERMLADKWWRGKIGESTSETLGAALAFEKEVYPDMRMLWDEYVLPIAEAYPYLAGYERPAEFFFVIQNNSEMRATGGFFGTYGRLNITDGDVGKFGTDNVYNIDYPAERKGLIARAAPEPIRIYVKEPIWYLRDGNWYPDWPMSAALMQEMFQDEMETDSEFTAIIGINPMFIEKILEITGPIEYEGKKFAADSIIDMLETDVGRDFQKLGLNIFTRKEIINQLAERLVEKLKELSPVHMIELFGAVRASIEDRSIFAYSSVPELQSIIEDMNADGALKDVNGDYVLVVDSNLGSLKSDPAVDRSIAIKRNEKERTQTVSVTYKHRGTFDWKTTRYRNWMRVYVPKGSTLISADGLFVMDRNPVPGEPEVYEESGKTVFAGFTNIEPGRTHTVTWTYALPRGIDTDETYIQAQPGIEKAYTVGDKTYTHTVRDIIHIWEE